MDTTVVFIDGIVASHKDVLQGPAYIVIKDGRIAEYGLGTYEARDNRPYKVVRRKDSIAIPGFVNAHGHAAMTLLRGVGDDLHLQDWLEKRILPREAKLTEEAVYWGTQLACWEMLTSGITAYVDMYLFMAGAAKAVLESGIRGALSFGATGLTRDTREQSILQTKALIEEFEGSANGRIRTMVAPHAPYTCPPDFLSELVEISARYDVPMQIHLSETKAEVEDSLAAFGCTPIEHARRRGLFSRPLLAAHCVHLTDEDIDLLRAGNVRVAHNPQSNLKLASGVAPVAAMKRAGVCVGLGTDGAASNNNLDLFEELRLAATLHKAIDKDPKAIPAVDAFTMATRDGAACSFLTNYHGTISVGDEADFSLMSLRHPHFIPEHDIFSRLVYAADAGDVTDVFIQGQHVLQHREPMQLDTERIRYEVNRLRSSLDTMFAN